MKKTFLILSIFVAALPAVCQKKIEDPFKVLVMQPDTVILDPSLYADRDIFESKMIRDASAQGIQFPSGFRYYHIISKYSAAILKMYLLHDIPSIIIDEIEFIKPDLPGLSHIADSCKADFIVFYTQIHSITQDQLRALQLTTNVYSRKTNSIVLSKATVGDANSRGEEWTCDITNNLSCPLINSVRTSVQEVDPLFRELRKQGRK